MNAIHAKLSRRRFVVAAAAGGGLALGFHLPAGGARRAAASTAGTEVNAWIVIDPDDTVTIRVARSEMGQGSQTGLCALVADELDCDWSKVKAEFASTNEQFKRKRVWGSMATNGSQAIRLSQAYVRRAGAAAREMLIASAAALWQAPASECRAENGVITHSPTGRRLRYGELAADAARLEPPRDVALKNPKDWKIAGKRLARFDIPDKVMGKPVYAIDVRLPGMLYAAIRQCPVFGGRVKSYDEAALAGMKGVHQVVVLGDAIAVDSGWRPSPFEGERVPRGDSVAVVADTFWHAKEAVERLPIVWDDGANAGISSATIAKSFEGGLDGAGAAVARKDGDTEAEFAKGAKIVAADYETPFLDHAAMEPMNCTALVTADKVEVWVATQNGETTAAAAAAVAGLPLDKVHVNKMMLGGGFGRRSAFQEPTRQAVAIAKAVPGRPVKLIWTREEDMQHGRYRPASMARQRAALGPDGLPTAWTMRVSGPSIMQFISPAIVRNGLDRTALTGLADHPYGVANFHLDYALRNTHVPVGFWRAVNNTQNAFYREVFVDELAAAAGADPYLYRRRLLAGEKARRDLAVLDAAAKQAEWERPAAAGTHRGIAVFASFASYVAAVAEITMADGMVEVRRVVMALDSGHVVLPDAVEAQVQGSVAWAVTATLFGEITIAKGRVEQSNFHDFPVLKIDRMPKVETVLVPSGGFWGGIGEPPVPPVAPAIVNAVFAATGKRIRSLPLVKHGLVKA